MPRSVSAFFALSLCLPAPGCAQLKTAGSTVAEVTGPPAAPEQWSRAAPRGRPRTNNPTPASARTSAASGAWVGLCDPASPAFAEASRKYEALAERVARLDPAAAAKGFNEAANDLLAHECFALAVEDEPLAWFEFDFGVEVKAFWEAGGDVWLGQYLALTDPTNEDIWVRPSPRKAVTRQTHADHALARFLCSAELEDDPCTAAVAGWHSRADRYYELWSTNPKERHDDCLELAQEGPKRQAYASWHACETKQAGVRSSLPLGGLGVVDEGWIVVRGRRGHYGFCDGITAYDLKSGSVYRVESCGGLALSDGGGVDHRKTDAGRELKVETGTVPVALLREAAWATLSAPFVQDDIVHEYGFGRPVPDGFEIGRHESSSLSRGISFGMSFSSGHTTLDWQWVDGIDAVPLVGQLSWPNDLNDPAGDHAVRLLQIAEDAMTPGCAAAKLPPWLADGLELGGVSGLDADDQSLNETSEALRDAMADAAARGRCSTGSPAPSPGPAQ